MLKILIPTTMLMPTVWLTPPKWMWPAMLCHSFLIALISTAWLKNFSETGWSCLSPYLGTDPISAPLLVLTCWLLPLMILASQNHLTCEPAARQRTYLALLALLQLFLILAFSTTEVLLFYIMFEATLVPTLALITRWGNQTQRLNAGTYLLLFTLAGSLPLLVALLTLRNNTETLSMLLLSHSSMLSLNLFTDKLWWASCLLAFLVKMPMYGVHLWLPKAHVEAPVAGSMVLAAILLKLGGYGMIRVLVCLEPLTQELSYPFIILALWGLIMAGSVCTLQTDLKSLIAYSSVSHMGLVIGALLIQTPWGLSGAMTLMIAHGLTSSALFCLANTNYERTHSRTMTLARGMQLILPLGTTWWLTTSLANLALPPLPNLVGELMILTSLFNWSQWTIMLTGASMFITAAYSLYMFITTQRGPAPPHMLGLEPAHTREHLMMVLHLLPLVLLISKPELVWA